MAVPFMALTLDTRLGNKLRHKDLHTLMGSSETSAPVSTRKSKFLFEIWTFMRLQSGVRSCPKIPAPPISLN